MGVTVRLTTFASNGVISREQEAVMTLKPLDAEDLMPDLPEGEDVLLDETIYDEVESYYGDDLLDLIQS